MCYQSPAYGKVFGNICAIDLMLHVVLPDLLLQIVNNCNVNILVCASINLKVLPPGIMGYYFQWEKNKRFLITLENFPVIHWLNRCVIFSSQVWIWCGSLHWLGCCFSLASGRCPTLLLLPPKNILPNTPALSQACTFQWERLRVTQKQNETTLEQTENGHWNTIRL